MKKLIASGFVLSTLLGITPQIITLSKANTINTQSKIINQSKDFNYLQELLTIKNEQNNEKLNWNDIKIQLNNQFQHHKQNLKALKSNFSKNNGKIVTNKNIEKALKLAQEKATSAFTSTYFIGHIFYKILYPVLISLNAAVTATSWVFPAVLSLIPITSTILALVN